MFKLIDVVTSKHGRVDSELSRFLQIAHLDNGTAPVSAQLNGRGEVSIGGAADGTDVAAVLNEFFTNASIEKKNPLSAALCSCKRVRLSIFLRMFAS